LPFDPRGASDTLTLIVNGQTWAGWQRVWVTRSMDMMPASFQIQVTEKYPTAPADMDFSPGNGCQVMIGNDLVLTGWIDRYQAMLLPDNHIVTIFGRSLSEDLVDCSAFLGDPNNPSFQIMGGTALSIAQQLAQPYNVTINAISQGNGVQIPNFNINLGETVWEIIDRMLRYSQLIAYDMPDGSVQFAQANAGSMASGFTQGVNVEQATVTFSMDQRFQQYEAHILSSDAFSNQGGAAATAAGIAYDNGVPRFRKRIIVSEQYFQGQPIADQRAQWECNRRQGRSMAVTLRCDAWRDTAGSLWNLNYSAPLYIPAIKAAPADGDWIIGAVTFQRDEMGQHALVTMMPAAAFLPEPQGDLNIPLLSNPGQNNPTATPNPTYNPQDPTQSIPAGRNPVGPPTTAL
jgi:prophage tail gpP-like protein